MSVKSKSNELHLTRVYDAPVAAVWDAWTDPEQVAQWWGPRGFTITTHSKDLRPGGHWRYTMHGPDGVDYANVTNYLEVEKHKKLVYDHGGNDERKPLFRVTVLFSESGGKTTMDMTMAFASPEAAEQSRRFIKKAGGESTWDRLAEFIEERKSGKEKFVINRAFDAPIDAMFSMWTEPEHLSKWLPPVGFDMKFIHADIRTGGKSFFSMSNSAGLTMYARAEYREVRRPDLLVYVQQFCDENENVSRHPFAPTWPATMLTTVQFTSEGAEFTRVTVTTEVIGDVTSEEMSTFIEGRSGMTIGWTGSFDKLEEHLPLVSRK